MADKHHLEISVIVPVYNVEPYLRKCVDSLLNQTISGYEIILVDDGSTDGSGFICDEYAASHPLIVRVIHQRNQGVSAARNAGIDQSQSKYITFVDGDDWVDNQYLAALYAGITQYDADLSCCGIVYDTSKSDISPVNSSGFDSLSKSDVIQRILLDPQFYGYGVNKLFKRDMLHGLRFDTALKMSEDMWFVVSYAKNIHNAVFTPDKLYHYRMRAGSATADFRFSDKFITGLEVNHRLIEVYPMRPAITRYRYRQLCQNQPQHPWANEAVKPSQ